MLNTSRYTIKETMINQRNANEGDVRSARPRCLLANARERFCLNHRFLKSILIQKKVAVIMILLFLFMLGVLYFVLYSSTDKISAYSLIHSDNMGPDDGTPVFSQFINENELDYLMTDLGIALSVLDKRDTSFSDAQNKALEEGGTVVTIINDNQLTAYRVFDDMFGDSNMLLSISDSHYAYQKGIRFIAAILIIIALCCMVMISGMIKLFKRATVKSMPDSAYEVNRIDVETGGNMYGRYESVLNNAFQRKLYIENKIRKAINNECREFRAYFQPKALSETGEIVCCEALIRWVTKEGVIDPEEFIPLAEESGLIMPLSKWMLKESCRCNKLFEKQGIDNVVSVNIPAQVLLHNDFLYIIKNTIRETGMDAKKLDIEITESTVLSDVIRVNEIFDALHRLGVTVSIDDFGTGYSSLSYLQKLSVDRIKIDRSFIVGLTDNDEVGESIVNAIVSMGKSLHMIITAEGVEHVTQYEYLKNIKCDEIQGFYISKPIPFEEYIDFSKNWNPREDVSLLALTL